MGKYRAPLANNDVIHLDRAKQRTRAKALDRSSS